MNQLESLLNYLIEIGWEPWGEKSKKTIIRSSRIFVYNSEGYINPEGEHVRQLVSLESGLWQFVCSQKLLSDKVDMKDSIEDSYGLQDKPYDKDGFYWVMRCAKLEEEKLAQFLVENIILGKN